jgi:formylglycine-generating enzyme required for sulfatase activity
MRFCIDRYEYAAANEGLPRNDLNLLEAARICSALGKRLCSESEWTFACEGQEMFPYPYGFQRAPICNQDRWDLLAGRAPEPRRLRDQREPTDAHPRCVSPFGAYNMVGNVDEITVRDGAPPGTRFTLALKGGWWGPLRNRCRPATTAHDDSYRGVQVGVRCCLSL